MNNTKKIVVIFLLIFVIGTLAGIFGYLNAKITTFEKCENSWLLRSITFYDYAEYVPNAIEKKCTLWAGKSFVKLMEANPDNINSSSSPFFPTQKKPATSVMQALLSNKPEELKLVNGCFRVNNGIDDYLIIWPYGFSFSTDENGVVQINNETDQPIMYVGDKVKFGGGGGEMSGGDSGDASAVSAELPSNRCSGPYWILGEIVEIISDEPNN